MYFLPIGQAPLTQWCFNWVRLYLLFQPIDQAPLRHSDVLILSCLTQTPLTNPDSMIGEFCVNAGEYKLVKIALINCTVEKPLTKNQDLNLHRALCWNLFFITFVKVYYFLIFPVMKYLCYLSVCWPTWPLKWKHYWYRIQPNYRTVRLGFSKALENLVVKIST